MQACHVPLLAFVSVFIPVMRLLHTSRLITPEEFDTMRKYDVTGIGLNLGTAEDFVRKTGVPLPKGQDMSQVRSVEGAISAAAVEQLHPATSGRPSLLLLPQQTCAAWALDQLSLPPHCLSSQPAGSSCLASLSSHSPPSEEQLKPCTGRNILILTTCSLLG